MSIAQSFEGLNRSLRNISDQERMKQQGQMQHEEKTKMPFSLLFSHVYLNGITECLKCVKRYPDGQEDIQSRNGINNIEAIKSDIYGL